MTPGRLDAAVWARFRWLPRRPETVAVVRGLTVLGEPVGALGCALLADRISSRGRAGRAPWPRSEVAMVVGGLAVRRVLAESVARQRPPREGWLVEPQGYSFPSKHATASALTAAVIARSWPAARPAAVALAAVTGLTRLYLGVHWLTDVAAGWALGAGWATVWRAALAPGATPQSLSASPGLPGPSASG